MIDARKLEIEDIRNVVRHEAGRRFLYRILENSGVHSDMFEPDPYVNAHNSGRQSAGRWTEAEIKEAAPEFYLMMIKEHATT